MLPDEAPRADLSMDHRRYRLSQEGTAFGRVARQYCGELGKQDNCQVAVTLSIANRDESLPVACRLYLPKEWARGRKRRAQGSPLARQRRSVFRYARRA